MKQVGTILGIRIYEDEDAKFVVIPKKLVGFLFDLDNLVKLDDSWGKNDI